MILLRSEPRKTTESINEASAQIVSFISRTENKGFPYCVNFNHWKSIFFSYIEGGRWMLQALISVP